MSEVPLQGSFTHSVSCFVRVLLWLPVEEDSTRVPREKENAHPYDHHRALDIGLL